MSFDTERFIIEIQNRPCLWDTSLNDYSDRNLKIKCWDEIVNIFKEKDEMTNQEKKQLGKCAFIFVYTYLSCHGNGFSVTKYSASLSRTVSAVLPPLSRLQFVPGSNPVTVRVSS